MLKKIFKPGIAGKLAWYYVAAFTVFALIIGIIFTVLFYNNTKNLYVENMMKDAKGISDAMSSLAGSTGSLVIGDDDSDDFSGENEFPDGFDRRGDKFRISTEDFSRLISRLTDSTVWLISPDDSDEYNYSMMFLMRGNSYSDTDFTHLSEKQQAFIDTIYAGYRGHTSDFGTLFGEGTLTVGVPIMMEDGTIIGVVLLHSSSSSIKTGLFSGLTILIICLIIAIVLGVIYAVIFGKVFSLPLRKINSAALMISEGDYGAVTDVHGNDEIGVLANTIDNMGGKLKAAEEESEKLEKMRKDFVANISHELRTPVTVIKGSLEALTDGVVTDPETVSEYHEEMLSESIYMQRLVNDLLDLSRLQNSEFFMNMSDFNLCDCINDAVRSARRIGNDRKICVNYSFDTRTYQYHGDYDRIRQMLTVVLDNALKFTDNSDNPVEVIFRSGVVSVSNIGCGISPEELPYIFERFHKSRSEANKNGTGLGLAIAKQIAMRHNIDLSVTSNPGEKTVFYFKF